MNQKWREVGTPGIKLFATDLADIWLRSEGRCAYCGIEITAGGVSFDHIVPFDRRGANVPGNLAASCMTCQRNKHTKSPEDLMAWRSLIRQCKGCGTRFRPRWADYQRGYGHYCSRVCSGRAGGEA